MDKKIITILLLKFLLIWTYSTDQSKCIYYYNYGKKKTLEGSDETVKQY